MPFFHTKSGFFKALDADDIKTIEKYLSGRNPSKWLCLRGDTYGSTPLHIALRHQEWDIARLMIDRGANVEVLDGQNKVPLHYAARFSGDITRLLISKGASLDCGDEDGNTPLHIAAENGCLDSFLALVESGADLTPLHKENFTILHMAVKGGNIDIVNALISRGADIHALTTTKNTPMFYAACGKADIIELLARLGGDVNAQNKHGDTPAHYAYVNTDNLRVLAAFNANLNAQDKNGNTPLHDCLKNEYYASAAYLVNHGVDTTVKNNKGETARDMGLRKETRYKDLFKTPERLPAPSEEWIYLCDNKIAHVETYPALSRKITAIFNFNMRERTVITADLSTGVEAAPAIQSFEDIGDIALTTAAEAFHSTGHPAPGIVLKTRLHKTGIVAE
jgi:ankyrin repeat protein